MAFWESRLLEHRWAFLHISWFETVETRNVGTPSFFVPLVPGSVGLCLEAEEVITGQVRRYSVPGGSLAMSLHMTSDLAHPRRWGTAIPHTLCEYGVFKTQGEPTTFPRRLQD